MIVVPVDGRHENAHGNVRMSGLTRKREDHQAIGFDDTPHERRRAERGCKTFAIQVDERGKYDLWFPLQEWRWTRADCVYAIVRGWVDLTYDLARDIATIERQLFTIVEKFQRIARDQRKPN